MKVQKCILRNDKYIDFIFSVKQKAYKAPDHSILNNSL